MNVLDTKENGEHGSFGLVVEHDYKKWRSKAMAASKSEVRNYDC